MASSESRRKSTDMKSNTQPSKSMQNRLVKLEEMKKSLKLCANNLAGEERNLKIALVEKNFENARGIAKDCNHLYVNKNNLEIEIAELTNKTPTQRIRPTKLMRSN